VAKGVLKRNRKLAQPRKRWEYKGLGRDGASYHERDGEYEPLALLEAYKNSSQLTHKRSGNFKRAWPTFPGNGLGTSTTAAAAPVPAPPSPDPPRAPAPAKARRL